jgi:hypothetical protein
MQMAETEQQNGDGVSVALNGDSARIDTMQQSNLQVTDKSQILFEN